MIRLAPLSFRQANMARASGESGQRWIRLMVAGIVMGIGLAVLLLVTQ